MAFYGTLAEADAYHLERGNAAWPVASAENREAALVRGSDYIDQRYRWQLTSGRWQTMFPGERTLGRDQAREWPRTGAADYSGNPIAADAIPIEVLHGTFEAALRELLSPGSLSPDFIPGGQVIREKVGPVEIGYAEPKLGPNMVPNRPIVPMIDEIMAPLTFRPYSGPAVVVV